MSFLLIILDKLRTDNSSGSRFGVLFLYTGVGTEIIKKLQFPILSN